METLKKRVLSIVKSIEELTPEEKLAGRTRAIAFLDKIPQKLGVLIKVNKQMVRDLLLLNTKNRILTTESIKKLLSEMNGNHFVFNGDTVRYDVTYAQGDGQTRYYSFLLSDLEEIEFMFITGLDPSVIFTIDKGRPRTLIHDRQIRGDEQAGSIPAVTKILRGYKTGDYHAIKSINDRELDEFYRENVEEIQRAITKGDALYAIDSTKATSAILGACYYLCAEKSEEDADSFFNRLITGVGLFENAPELTLGRYLNRERVHLKHSSTQKVVSGINHILYAWNKYRKGEPLKNFRGLTTQNVTKFIDVI